MSKKACARQLHLRRSQWDLMLLQFLAQERFHPCPMAITG
jgi:hypothetical protein